MSLKSRIEADRTRVFMNPGHFAETHSWNGKEFTCVTDEESAMKRKNLNVNDISWDNNTRDTMVYVPEENFPGRAIPNESGFFDNVPMRILQVSIDGGMLCIVMACDNPKAVAAT